MRTALITFAVLGFCVIPSSGWSAEPDAPFDLRFPLFAYLTETPAPAMITYTPSELDPRQPANQGRLKSSSIRADLVALRPHFDGLILYGYHEACTPRIVAIAKELKFRAVILGIWDPKSTAELDGVIELAKLYQHELALGILVGNEGLTFNRYEAEDLLIADKRLRSKLPQRIPLATSEPLVGYKRDVVRTYGDFLAPNIHPVFDRKELGPAEAANWARGEALQLAETTGKPVLLKETGFPHAGAAKYSPESQREFWAEYTKPGLLTHTSKTRDGEPPAWVYHGVAFEAFDLPWKSEESKLPIESSWGLLSAKRIPYPALSLWKSIEREE